MVSCGSASFHIFDRDNCVGIICANSLRMCGTPAGIGAFVLDDISRAIESVLKVWPVNSDSNTLRTNLLLVDSNIGCTLGPAPRRCLLSVGHFDLRWVQPYHCRYWHAAEQGSPLYLAANVQAELLQQSPQLQ